MSEPERVIQLAERVDDVRYDSVRDTIERALEQISDESSSWAEDDFRPTFCTLVFVDERKGSYRVRINQSSGTLTRRIALLEVAKLLSFKEMGYGG